MTHIARCDHCPAEDAWATQQRLARMLVAALLTLPRPTVRGLLNDWQASEGDEIVEALRNDLNAAIDRRAEEARGLGAHGADSRVPVGGDT